jgi:hypothetical protein
MSSEQALAGTADLPILLNDEAPKSVYELIDNCPPERLASLMKKVCTEDTYFSAKLRLVLRGTTRVEVAYGTEQQGIPISQPSNEATALDTTPLKRKELNDVTNDVSLPNNKKSKTEKLEEASSTHAVCKNCNALFKHADNEMGDCVYHEGKSFRHCHQSSMLLHRCVYSSLVDAYQSQANSRQKMMMSYGRTMTRNVMGISIPTSSGLTTRTNISGAAATVTVSTKAVLGANTDLQDLKRTMQS